MLCFSIRGWRAASTRMADDDAWRAWAANPSIARDLPPQRPALEFLGAMQRRRLSGVARLMVDAAWPLVQDDEHLPVVYVSHDGEINRSFELWLTLLKEGTVSPTSFGLSVHNAPAGQWSMLRGDMSEHTALAAGSDNFETTLAEAYALLQDGAPSVLVLIADDPLSDDYPVHATRAPFAYALLLVLTQGDDYTLSLKANETSSENPSDLLSADYWGALDWIRFLLSDDLSAEWQHEKRRWTWCKKP